MSKAFFFGVFILASISSRADGDFFPANTTVVLNKSVTAILTYKDYYMNNVGFTTAAGWAQQKKIPLSDGQYCVPLADIKGDIPLGFLHEPKTKLTFAGKDVGDAPTSPRKLLSSEPFESYEWYSLSSPEAGKCQSLELDLNNLHTDHKESSPEFASKKQDYFVTCIKSKSHSIELTVSSPNDANTKLKLICHVNSLNRGDIKKALDPLITLNYKMGKEDQPSASPAPVTPVRASPAGTGR